VSQKPRDHDLDDRAVPPAADGNACPAHPVSRPALHGHVFRRHLRAAASSERR
jgi:hypothetical protein